MPTNKQRRQAAQRHLQQQLERRAELARKRRRNLRHPGHRGRRRRRGRSRRCVITGVFSGDDDTSDAAGRHLGGAPTTQRRGGRPRTPTARSPAPTARTTRATRTSRTSARRPRPRRPRPRAPSTLLMSTNQGDLDAHPGPGEGPLRRGQLRLPGVAEVLRRQPVPPRGQPADLRRPAVRRPDRHRLRRPELQVRPGDPRRGRPTRAAPSPWRTPASPAPPAASSSCASSTPSSAPDYTAVGTVDEAGLAVLDKIAAAGNDGSFEAQAGGGAPNLPVTINTMTVVG